jgi:maltose O-acetyltransferase
MLSCALCHPRRHGLYGCLMRALTSTSRRLRLLLMNGIAMAYPTPNRVRLSILRLCGVRVANATVLSRTLIRTDILTIGDGAFLNHNCLLDVGEITLGPQVFLGPAVILATASHKMGDPALRAGDTVVQPINIGAGAWLGARVTVLGGVTVGAGCVIAAGSVVTRDTEPNSLYAGTPAALKRRLPS